MVVLVLAVVSGLVTSPGPAQAQASSSGEHVFVFGDATFHGSTRPFGLAGPIVDIAAHPGDGGYWSAASDGGVFAFGDAVFHGSMGGLRLNRPVVGMAASPSGGGYWLVASDGGVFAFGDAAFHGSMGGVALAAPIVDLAGTPDGDGYWMAAGDGGVFALGAAGFHGSGAGGTPYQPIVGIAPTSSGAGYWLQGSGVCVFDGSHLPRSSLPESHVMLLTDIRTAPHGCFERIVFDFRDEMGAVDGTISYEVRYADPPFAGPSGLPEEVDGQAFIEIAFRPARGHTGPEAEPTYTGPAEIEPADLEFVEEVQRIEDFEATLVWVVGLDQRRLFNVFQLDSPDRFVLDIGPPPAPAGGASTTAQVFFTPRTSLQVNCREVRGITRTVASPGVLRAAMHELLEGPTGAEEAAGLTSWFSEETAGMLDSVSVRAGTARIDFDDFSGIIPNASTSCGSASLLAQLDATATQFPAVDRAVYSFGGDVRAFYDWLQREPPR